MIRAASHKKPGKWGLSAGFSSLRGMGDAAVVEREHRRLSELRV